MKRVREKAFRRAMGLLAVFLLWTSAVRFVDVQAIGPQGTSVGFATLNGFMHQLTGVHMTLYTVTDWLGLVPFGFVLGFGCLGLMQWIQRKQLRMVDWDILVLGGFYLAVLAAYAIFEVILVNYRPVLIEGCPEVSYPSSTTMLVLCVIPTAIMQLNARLHHKVLKQSLTWALSAFLVFMVIGRLLSGVHWLTDIIGGALLSGGLVQLYRAMIHIE